MKQAALTRQSHPDNDGGGGRETTADAPTRSEPKEVDGTVPLERGRGASLTMLSATGLRGAVLLGLAFLTVSAHSGGTSHRSRSPARRSSGRAGVAPATEKWRGPIAIGTTSISCTKMEGRPVKHWASPPSACRQDLSVNGPNQPTLQATFSSTACQLDSLSSGSSGCHQGTCH
jgi:hypothetical protein